MRALSLAALFALCLVSAFPGSATAERRRSLEQCVAEAQVILVATALDSGPAPPNRPGDLPETFIRFRVSRVLKGPRTDTVVTTRTPTAPGEFIGKPWILMLSPEHVAGKHSYAGCYTISLEETVKTILAREQK